jgi:hypothetical protein
MILTDFDREFLQGLLIEWEGEQTFEPKDDRAFHHVDSTLLMALIHPDGSVTRREFDNRADSLAWIQIRRGPQDVLMMHDTRTDVSDFVSYDYFQEMFEGETLDGRPQ